MKPGQQDLNRPETVRSALALTSAALDNDYAMVAILLDEADLRPTAAVLAFWIASSLQHDLEAHNCMRPRDRLFERALLLEQDA